jgi:hypothetical protein
MIGLAMSNYLLYKKARLSSLNLAIASDNFEAAQTKGIPINHSSNWLGKNPLEVAIECENKEAFSFLLIQGSNPHSQDANGLPIIHRVCTLGDPFWLEQVLDNGGDPNLMWPGNWTERPRRPMCVAMRSKQFHLVPILVEAGASLSEPIMTHPHADYSPLGYAADGGPEGVATVIYLLEKGAKPDLSKVPSSIRVFAQDGPDASWRRPITKWFEDHGQDIRNAKWDGKQWVIPPFIE